jgi:hypothetical protein
MEKILKIGSIAQDVIGYILEVLKLIKKRKSE